LWFLFQEPGSTDTTHYPDGDPAKARSSATELLFRAQAQTPGISRIFVVGDLYVDSTFTQSQKDIIAKAYKLAKDRLGLPLVRECADSNSNKDKADVFYKVGNSRSTTVRISRIWDEPDVVGKGYINIVKTYRPSGGATGIRIPAGFEEDFIIALNSDYIGNQSLWKGFSSPDYWAGVITHEMLHNLGLRHPNGYEGSYIEVYGDCVWHNGVLPARRTFSLNDNESEPTWIKSNHC
jgi:hypothetical protein